MAPSSSGSQPIHIINLERTLPLLQRRGGLSSGRSIADRGKVLFVGTKRSARDAVKKEAARCAMPYVSHRWLGGMLTNFRRCASRSAA